MRTTRRLYFGLWVSLGAALVHLAGLAALPYLVMGRFILAQSSSAGENVFVHYELPTAAWRERVRPCPDLAYSSAVFDVSEGPLHVVVPMTAPYTSLAGYARNTDTFFAVNDRTGGGPVVELVLVGPSTPRNGLEGLRVVESPTDAGVLLVRRVVPSGPAFASIDDARRRARVEFR